MAPRKKVVDEDAQPDIAQMPLFVISTERLVEIEKNRQNLLDAGLYHSMKVVFEPQNDYRLRAFLKSSSYGALDEVNMMDRVLPFDIDAVSRCLRLPQEGMTLSGATHFTEEHLKDVFEPKAKTDAGYLLAKAKGIWKEWLSYVNYRILLPQTPKYISEVGVGAALMAWNGMPLNWSKIIYNAIKVELIQKQTRGPMVLYSAVYLTKMMDPTQPPIPTPEKVNLTLPMEIGETSRAKKRKEAEQFCIRPRAQGAGSSSMLQLPLDGQEMEVNLVNATEGDILQEIRQEVVQEAKTRMTGLTMDEELTRTLGHLSIKYKKLNHTVKQLEADKVKLTGELEVRRQVVVNLTKELEQTL
jgi:hypothetical protein